VLEKNPETVKVVFKNFPLRFHKQAIPAAEAALAAHEQGKFWEFHNELFTLKSNELSPKKYEEIAKKLFLDMDSFNKDISSPKIRQHIFKDMQTARTAGVNSTPSVYINGWRFQGRRTAQSLQQKIDAELAKLSESKQ